MLSLEHAASGTNLIEATHVVLIDPVAGTKQRSVAVESQAIGRAHRMGQNKRVSGTLGACETWISELNFLSWEKFDKRNFLVI